MPELVQMGTGIIQLALSIAMIVIGDRYNTLDSCSIQISQVLEVMGGLMLFIAILEIMVGLVFCTEAIDECGTICAIIVVTSLAYCGVLIWASVVVFGAYKTWEYEDNSSENFCEYTPYMFAFVILIIQWLGGVGIIGFQTRLDWEKMLFRPGQPTRST